MTEDPDSQEDPELRPTRAATRSRRLPAVATGVVVAGAAAAVVVGVAAAPHGAPDGTHQAGGQRQILHRVAAPTAAARPAANSVTYVHGGLGGDVWIPADRSGTWQFRRAALDPGGPDINEKATCAAFPFFRVGTTYTVGPEGTKHYSSHDHVPNCHQGDWTFYRPKFAASLPTDPAALLGVMRKASYQGSDVNTFVTGQEFIGSGEVEPAVVGNVVAALKRIPGVHVQQGVGNGAGATGEALSFTGQAKRGVTETWTVIVNRADQVIGTKLAYAGGKDHESLSYTKVDHLGDTE